MNLIVLQNIVKLTRNPKGPKYFLFHFRRFLFNADTYACIYDSNQKFMIHI
jgi:hypothetical protein